MTASIPQENILMILVINNSTKSLHFLLQLNAISYQSTNQNIIQSIQELHFIADWSLSQRLINNYQQRCWGYGLFYIFTIKAGTFNNFIFINSHIQHMHQLIKHDQIRPQKALNASYTVNTANSYMLQQEYNHAINFYEIALNKHEGTSVKSPINYFRNPQYYLEQLIHRKQLQINPVVALPLCYSMNNNYQKGQFFFEELKGNQNERAVGLLGLAHLYNIKGQINKALQLYLEIYEKHHEKRQALQQLIFLYFSQGNDQKAKQYLKKIQFQSQQIKALSNLYKNPNKKSSQQSISHVQSSPYWILKVRVLTFQSNLKEMLKIYESYSKRDQKNVLLEQILLSNIFKMYNRQGNFSESLEYAKLLHNVSPDSWLYMIYLGFHSINAYRLQQGISLIRQSLQSLKNIGISYLTNQNRQFTMQLMVDLLKLLQKVKFSKNNNVKSKIDEIATLFYSLSNARDDNINSNINKARFKKNQIFSMVSSIVEKGYEVNQIFKPMFQLYKKKEDYIGFFYIFFSKYASHLIHKEHHSLMEVERFLQNGLRQFYNASILQKSTQVCQKEDLKQKYKTKNISYNPKVIDLFHLRCYFTNHRHLIAVLQGIIKQSVKPKLSILNNLISQIKNSGQINAFDIKIIQKCSDSNKYIELNEIIEQLLPEIKEHRYNYLQEVDSQIRNAESTNMNGITTVMVKQWQKIVTNILKQKRIKKKSLKCMLQDWITVQLTFSNHLKLIKCLELIQSWKDNNKYDIINIKGDLRYSREEVINVVVNIKDVNCTMKLMVDSQHLLKRKYQLQVKKLTSNSVGIVFASLMNLNKKKDFSVFQYMQQAQQYYKSSRQAQQAKIFNTLRQFTDGIQFINSFEKISVYEKRPQSMNISQNKSLSQASFIQSLKIEDQRSKEVYKERINRRKERRLLSNLQFSSNQKELRQQMAIHSAALKQIPVKSEVSSYIYQTMSKQEIIKILLDQQEEKQQMKGQRLQLKQLLMIKKQQIRKIIQQLQKCKHLFFRKEQNNAELVQKIVNLQNTIKDYQSQNKYILEDQSKLLQQKDQEILSIRQHTIKQIQMLRQQLNQQKEQIKNRYSMQYKQFNNQMKIIQQEHQNSLEQQRRLHQRHIQQKAKENKINCQIMKEIKQRFDIQNDEHVLQQLQKMKQDLQFNKSQIFRLQQQRKQQLNTNIYQTPKKEQKTKKKNYNQQLEQERYKQRQKQNQIQHNIQKLNMKRLYTTQKNDIQAQNQSIRKELFQIKSIMNGLQVQMKKMEEMNQSKQTYIQNCQKKYLQDNLILTRKLEKYKSFEKNEKEAIVVSNTKHEWTKIIFGILFFLAISCNSLRSVVQ